MKEGLIATLVVATGSIGIGINMMDYPYYTSEHRHKLISENNNKGWEIRFNEYKQENNNDKFLKNDNSSKEDLKDWCLKNTKVVTKKQEEDWKRIENYCTNPKSIGEDLISKNYTIIERNNTTEWEKKVKVYKETFRNINDDSLWISMLKEKPTTSNGNTLREDITITKFQIYCENKIKDPYEEANSNLYKSLKIWCTKGGEKDLEKLTTTNVRAS